MIRSLYVAGDGFFHQAPIKVKLGALFFMGFFLFVISNYWLLGTMTLAAGGVYFSIRQPVRQALSRLVPVFLTILLVALFSLLVGSADEAILQLSRLTTLMLLAAAVTATTKIGDFIEAITLITRPLERIGLCKADDVGLALGLVVRFVPEVLSRYDAIREAHKARGLKVRSVTIIVPLIISTLQQADQVAQAIDARRLRQ